MTSVMFFDTYAFFEIIRGNPNYLKYENIHAITTVFNLAELNLGLKKEMNKKQADKYLDSYKSFLVDVSIDDIKEAMDLKMKYKDMSIPDCIGYMVAKRFKANFLTGDEDFRNMPNVEFVK